MEENKSPNQDLKETASDVRNLLNSAAENPMKNAAGTLNNSKQVAAKGDRDQAMTDAQNQPGEGGGRSAKGDGPDGEHRQLVTVDRRGAIAFWRSSRNFQVKPVRRGKIIWARVRIRFHRRI